MTKQPYKSFVVNVYDPLNYDIDVILLESDYRQRVIHNVYAYKNVQDGDLGEELLSSTHRCRLNGIEINNKHYSKQLVKQTIMNIRKLIDREDGWVICNIYGVDMFNRLLVDIYLPTLNINLCQWLLTRSATNLLYHKYHPKRLIK